jgi:hypothetical protein
MAGLASAFLALIILLPCTGAKAGDLFTGFQMDGEKQYFAYLGLRENLPWKPFDLQPFVQLFGAAQSYEYESGSRDIDADVQSLAPSLGITAPLGDSGWSLSTLVGPTFRWKKEDGFLNDSGREFDVGVVTQAEAMYWEENHSLHAMFSYGSLDDFFFGRIRGKQLAYSPDTGCCKIFLGLDVAGMGNNDFSAVRTGPLIEVPIGRFFLLVRGGYQYDSTFDSGGYGGLEIYTSF